MTSPVWVQTPAVAPPTRRALLRGVLAFRWLVLGWMAAVYLWEIWERGRRDDRVDVAHPWAGVALLGVALAITIAIQVAYRTDPDRLVRPPLPIAEIAVASLLEFLDTWVYGAVHSQALPTVWPLAAIFTVAIAAGTRLAVITGAGIGLARYVGWLVFPYPGDTGPWSLSRLASLVLFAVAGWVAGRLLEQQAHSDGEILAFRARETAFKAREEVARTLHDGVLQTLAVIQRRSDDDALIELARSQEHELRQYLFGAGRLGEETAAADLGTALRDVGRHAEQRYGLRVKVICAPDLESPAPASVAAITGAVTEALNNAAKHGGAAGATVYAEPFDDDTVFVSVKDDGAGFDHDAVTRGEGLDGSITGRIADAGGRVEIDGRPGRGAEIRMYV